MEVNCCYCGKKHNAKDNTYIKIIGNIYVGENGGIIGDNFPQMKESCSFTRDDIRAQYFCWNCFFKHMNEVRTDILNELEEQIKILQKKKELIQEDERKESIIAGL